MRVGQNELWGAYIIFLWFGPRYRLHLFFDYNHTTCIAIFSSLICSSPFYRGLSTLYSFICCILVFHLKGLGLFPLILVPSGLHWKTFTPSYKLWWHCLGIIFPLIWPAKCVQSFECKGDGCFIYIIPFFACQQIFLLFLGLCLMVFKTGLRPSRGHKSVLGVFGHCSPLRLVMSCSYFSRGLAVSAFRGMFF